MLVLTRKISEQIKVGENLILTVIKINGGRVKIGFADLTETKTPIVRMELLTSGNDSPAVDR
jgi:carbon storage regulator CsrA